MGNGTVVGWGENTDVQGLYAGQANPPSGLTNVVGLGAGGYHSLAVLRDGSVVAWGDDSEGQCEAPAGLSNVVAVAGGAAHSLALRGDGSVAAWGADWNGQCSLPASVGPNAVAVGAGAYHSLALMAGSLPVPRLWNPARQGGGFSVLVQSLNRKHYALEYASSLPATNWTAVSTNAGNGALMILSVQPAPGPERFYRMRQW